MLTWARSSGWPLWRSEDSLGVSKGKLELQGRKSEPGRWKNICKDTERRYIQGSVLERSVGAKSWRALYTHIWDVILKQSEAITSNLRNSFPQPRGRNHLILSHFILIPTKRLHSRIISLNYISLVCSSRCRLLWGRIPQNPSKGLLSSKLPILKPCCPSITELSLGRHAEPGKTGPSLALGLTPTFEVS